MGNIGEMSRQRNVNGRVALAKTGLFLPPRRPGDKRSGSKLVYGISEIGLAVRIIC
jgi:hypothetical protein